jgi:hypothetical protein
MFDLAVATSRVSQDGASLGKRYERFTKGYPTVKPSQPPLSPTKRLAS